MLGALFVPGALQRLYLPQGVVGRGDVVGEGVGGVIWGTGEEDKFVVGEWMGEVADVKGEAEGPYRFGPLDLWVREQEAEHARRLIDEARTEAAREGDGRRG